jgi:hypothetical protein
MSLSRARYIFLKRFAHTLLQDNKFSKIDSLFGMPSIGFKTFLFLDEDYFSSRSTLKRFSELELMNNNRKRVANTSVMKGIVHAFIFSTILYSNILNALHFSCILSYTMNNARVWSLIRMYFINGNYKIYFFTRRMLRSVISNVPTSTKIMQTFRNRCLWAFSMQNICTYEEAFSSVERCYKLSQFFNELTFGGFFLFGVFYTYENYKKIQERLKTFRIADLYVLWYSFSAIIYFFLVVHTVICMFYTVMVAIFFIQFFFGLFKVVKL